MAAPVQLAAIDAGSNAIRLVIARATSPEHIEILDNERVPVRLGHNAFTRRLIDNKTIANAAREFKGFRDRMDYHHTSVYRAVATAAAREARNYRKLMERIQKKSGIELEVISSEEEARLVCSAVQWVLGDKLQPRLIFDLGGGSLELNFFRGAKLQKRVGLPLGTIRLMETYSLQGAIEEDQAKRLRHHILALLRSAVPSPPRLGNAMAVACGGNAEALVRLAQGPTIGRSPSINVRLLKDQTWKLLQLDVAGRMRVFRLRKDRAEVLGIAAVVISTLAQWAGLRTLLVPGVGVREGILLDLVADQYSCDDASAEQREQAEHLVAGARWFGRRYSYDGQHAEQVARLALSLFDQLRPLHGMGPELRAVLEAGSLLHDVGHFVNRKSHQRHGEYLVGNGEIPGLDGWRQDMVAALVRYHNTKSEPALDHFSYSKLDGPQRAECRVLASLLRIAERLESEHAQRVENVDVQIEGRRAIFHIRAADGTRLDVTGLCKKAELFEREFHLKPEFRRVPKKQRKVA